MPDTVEHRVEMHQLARQRVAAGLPVWDRKINLADVFHNEAMSFIEIRDAVARRLRASTWLKDRDEFDELVEAVDNLAEAEDAQGFDEWWSVVYDHADADRMWINTH
jgi:hypothetical protein